jgi:cytoskeletal protein CcmA (bactofilin family)
MFTKTAGERMRDGSSDLATIIGQDAVLDGKLTVKHAMRIDGQVKGELNSTGTITIGETGRVEGILNAESVVIGGQVDGTIKTQGRITLEAGSRFTGDLEASKLVITEGATFNGHSTMPPKSAAGAGLGPRHLFTDKNAETRVANEP